MWIFGSSRLELKASFSFTMQSVVWVTLLWCYSGNPKPNRGTYLVNFKRYFSCECGIHSDLLSRSTLKIKAWLSSVICNMNAVGFKILRQFVHNWSALLDLLEQNTQVFLVSFMKQWHFILEEKGLQYCIHGHTVICIMTMMNNPSGTIWEKKPPNSPFRCMLIVFIHGS